MTSGVSAWDSAKPWQTMRSPQFPRHLSRGLDAFLACRAAIVSCHAELGSPAACRFHAAPLAGKRRIFRVVPCPPQAERRHKTGTSGEEMLKARILRIGISAAAIAGLMSGLSLAAGGTSLAAVQQRAQPVTSSVASTP